MSDDEGPLGWEFYLLLLVTIVFTAWCLYAAIAADRAEGQDCRDGVCVSGCDEVGGDPCQWVRYEPDYVG